MIQQDKIAHFIVGALISAAVSMLLGSVAGVCAALLIGAAKEWIWDAWLGKGQFEAADLWATVAGGLVSGIVVGELWT